MSAIYVACRTMFILSQATINVFEFPNKHLGRIVHGLCFSESTFLLTGIYINELGNVKRKKKKSKNGAAVTIQDQNVFFTSFCSIFGRRGGLMVVRWTPDRAVRVRALAGARRCVLGQDTLLS